jgi:diadenosine tetraphosphate (Ap4A) HIT family hydrolase
VEVVGKDVALAQLAEHKQRLLAGGGGCVMCALASGKADLPPVAEGRHAVVLLDRFACRYGHLLIIPHRHCEHLSQLPWEVFADVQRLTFEAARVIDECFKPVRVFTASLGAAVELPMTYSHYHMHVIPVYETDERARPARVLSWTEGVGVYDDAEAREICQKLVACWPKSAAGNAASDS